jgi:hypothetical protein
MHHPVSGGGWGQECIAVLFITKSACTVGILFGAAALLFSRIFAVGGLIGNVSPVARPAPGRDRRIAHARIF